MRVFVSWPTPVRCVVGQVTLIWTPFLALTAPMVMACTMACLVTCAISLRDRPAIAITMEGPVTLAHRGRAASATLASRVLAASYVRRTTGVRHAHSVPPATR